MEDDEFIMEPPDSKRIGKVHAAQVHQTAITMPTAPPSSPINRSPAFDQNDDGASNEASHAITSFFADDSSENSVVINYITRTTFFSFFYCGSLSSSHQFFCALNAENTNA